MNSQNQLQAIPIFVAFLLGLVIGLLMLSGGLFSAEFSDASPQHLSPRHLDNYVAGLAIKHRGDNDNLHIMRSICYPTDDYSMIAARAAEIVDPANAGLRGDYDQLLAVVANNGECDGFKAIAGNEPTVTSDRSWIWTLCGGGLLILGLLGLLIYFMRQNGQGSDENEQTDTKRTQRETRPPASVEDEIEIQSQAAASPPPQEQRRQSSARQQRRQAPPPPRASGPPTPLAGFQTTYSRGDDMFDKSFIIENANGDFLGECGVSISESIGASGDSKNVTAFEIWLFDKNDTHTVTKVVMSRHAYDDEGFRAKLATRGEPVLAHYDETIALETVSLIINADITEIDYTDIDPLDSTFDRFTIKLSAWVKAVNQSGDALDF